MRLQTKIAMIAGAFLLCAALMPMSFIVSHASSAPEYDWPTYQGTYLESDANANYQAPATTPYPTDIQLLEQGERNYLYKTYTVSANYDPDMLVEPVFTQAGYRYRFSEIIQRDSTPGSTSKAVTQNQTVDSNTGDKATILELLGNTLPYADTDGYIGELFLIPESLTVSEVGQAPYHYTITDTQQFELPSNDMSQIPKSVSKNGYTLQLQNVDWQVTGSNDMGYSGVPTSYTAIALYSAPASGTKASGYTATASYQGEVTKALIGTSTYSIVYEGEKIQIPTNYLPLFVVGILVIIGIAGFILFKNLRRNVTIYTLQHGVPDYYAKARVNPKKPVLDLSRVTDVGIRLVFDKGFIKSLYDQKVFVVGRYENYRIDLKGSLVQELPAQSPPIKGQEEFGNTQQEVDDD